MAKNFVLPPELTVENVVDVQELMSGYLNEPTLQADCDGSTLKIIDAAGLQLLLAYFKSSMKKGKVNRLVKSDPGFREIMCYTGADKVITLEGSVV